MRAVFELVRVYSDSDSTVIITGESGTGKEVTAMMIHGSSRRRLGPFVPISCALFSESLVESELFGHDRGAFTGALRDRPGRFELADGGTIFLDDIDDVPLSIQVKLLRVIQNRTVERLGGMHPIPVNIRILGGSKQDLKRMVAKGTFREDLYYRLNVLSLALPPLRDRPEDIPVLMEHFLTRHFHLRGEDMPAISQDMKDAFVRYRWPGNVRELENACERIAQTSTWGAPRGSRHLMIRPRAAASPLVTVSTPVDVPDESTSVFLDERIRALERSLIGWALRATNGNRSKAAARLHIKRSTLGDRIRRCGLDVSTIVGAGTDIDGGASLRPDFEADEELLERPTIARASRRKTA
jgi:transcriptional regulator with PAS, ATPase and Fis domain